VVINFLDAKGSTIFVAYGIYIQNQRNINLYNELNYYFNRVVTLLNAGLSVFFLDLELNSHMHMSRMWSSVFFYFYFFFFFFFLVMHVQPSCFTRYNLLM